jgi:glycosyltransferase involved in cell wall biosynthesis
MESSPRMEEIRRLRVSVVIPAYNEAKNLPYVLPLIPEQVHEVILVNDHSTDDTVEVASRLLPTIHIVNTVYGRGKGAALRAGFAEVTGDIVVMMDADGSRDPREMPRFIAVLLAGAYFVKGSRFLSGGSAHITYFRQLGASILIAITNRLFHLHTTDMFCGYNAFWKDCLDFFEVDRDGFEAETLMILRVCKANLDMVEVPSYEHTRIHGTGNFQPFRDSWRVLKTILREWLNGRIVVDTVRIHRLFRQEDDIWSSLIITRRDGAAL